MSRLTHENPHFRDGAESFCIPSPKETLFGAGRCVEVAHTKRLVLVSAVLAADQGDPDHHEPRYPDNEVRWLAAELNGGVENRHFRRCGFLIRLLQGRCQLSDPNGGARRLEGRPLL